MTSIIKRARVSHTFGSEDVSGWIPPHAPEPPRTNKATVDLAVQIERVEGGFVLQWFGPAPEYCGYHRYIELRFAEHAAEELFGITTERWDSTL
jgi:hypothetical protein